MFETVSLEEILDSREKRVELQNQLIRKYNFPIISFTLNIPGAVKDFKLSRRTFETGFNDIINEISKNGFEIISKYFEHFKTGSLGLISVNVDPIKLKNILCDLEENHVLGRLFDIDIIKTNFEKVSREEIHMPKRKCLLCRENAFICGRSRSHNVEELFSEVLKIMKLNSENNLIFQETSHKMVKALMYEVSASPKPGLVDRFNNGAHTDMNFFTFVDSALSLTKYFNQFTEAGFYFEGENLTELFKSLRIIGIDAEKEMFKVTKGINTHKGLIFSLGIVCAAYGYLVGKGEKYDDEDICNISSKMTKELIENDLSRINNSNAVTNGEKLYAKYGVTGIRGEAESGFKTVQNISLPIFSELCSKGYNINDVCITTLLHIMAELNDTNILHRHDFKTLEYVKSKSLLAIEKGDIFTEERAEILYEMDREFIEKNISPGGSADILVITIAIYLLREDKLHNV